ncbi:MAG: O-antigen ligase family protein [Verrucomicrobiae bacterium]|nr:O-antigen ligase family protein [Verrucomicrobiae bacterium]
MTPSDGASAARRRSGSAALAATAFLVALAPVKFSLPAVLRHLDAWPQGLWEWLFMAWPTEVFFGLLAFCLAFAAWEVRRSGVPLRPMIPAGIFLAAQGFSAAFTVDRLLTGGVLSLFATLVVGYALGCALGRDARGLRGLLEGWMAGAACVAWSGVTQATGGLEETRRFLEAHPELVAGAPELWDRVSRGRVFATFVYPNALGGYVATTGFLVAAWLAATRESGRRWARLAAGTLLTAALFFCLFKSQSKGGYAALIAAALVFAFGSGLQRRIALGLAGVVLALGAIGFAAGYGSPAVEKGKKTLSARVDYWRAAWRIGLDHPFLGGGPGAFAKLYPSYKEPDAENTRLVHNNYLQMWCDSGAIGFLAFAMLLPGTLFAWWRRWRAVPFEERLPLTLAWTGLVAFAIHSLVDFDLYLAGNAWPAFVLLGALAGSRPSEDAHAG